jgi:RNA polymerase sigma factor (sigma-70 family)
MIAKRRLIDRFRRRKRLDTVSLSTETSVDVAAASLDDVVERNEEVSRVRKQMHELRRKDRMILELSLEQGMSHSEIAAATSLPLGTVKTRVRRGLIRLRELLAHISREGEEKSRS